MENPPFKIVPYQQDSKLVWMLLIQIVLNDKIYYSDYSRYLNEMINQKVWEVLSNVENYHGTINKWDEIHFNTKKDADQFLHEYLEPRYVMNRLIGASDVRFTI